MHVIKFMYALALLGAGQQQSDNSGSPFRYWFPDEREAQKQFESRLNAVPTAKSLRTYHAMIATEPHVAGTQSDLRAVDKLIAAFKELGLEVEKQELWVYLCRPLEAALEIVWPERISLAIKEKQVPGDPYSAHSDLSLGWNAYSGDGDVTASVVYANYGTLEDFSRLEAMDVEVAGSIVIARYGGNYRGYKAKYAQAAGAVGLIIYTDPADDGYVQGIMYPEGGYANPTSIQRGSILTLNYAGDPLTPFTPATKDATRLDPEEVDLPKIPVQPVGWAAAEKVLSRMDGVPVPRAWQGGLPFTYRVTSGGGVTVRLKVKQRRELVKTYNVLGYLRGTQYPEQKVIIGCHHDAWTFGAGDPLSGTMVVYECAKSFAELARRGHTPIRTIVFANWAAEEFGLIGSVEWVEAHREDLMNHAVAYINLDMAVMGPNFASSSAAVLKSVIVDATRSVAPVGGVSEKNARTVYDAWVQREQDGLLPGHPLFGHLGGGSDHVGFYCHLAIPSAGLSVGGCDGVSYHSAYDNLAWYRKVVGDDYEPALVLTRIVNTVVARLANATLLPIDPLRYAPDVRGYLDTLSRRCRELGVAVDFNRLHAAITDYEAKAKRSYQRLLEALDAASLSSDQMACVNALLLTLERRWLTGAGLPGRAWYRNLYAATDETSGYAAWMLPALRYGIERKDQAALSQAVQDHVDVFDRLKKAMDEIDACVK